MNHFQKAVREAVATGLRGTVHPIRGVIPQGGIDNNTRLCTVQIPNPKGGKQSGAETVLTLTDLPLPANADGVILGILNLVKDAPRACTVGFKGGNLSFPYIISLNGFLTEQTDKQGQKVPNRNPATPQKATTKASPGTGSAPARGFTGPPNPNTAPAQPPTAAGSAATAPKLETKKAATSRGFQGTLNRVTDVKGVIQ